MLQITDYCPQGVAVMHGEFRGMGLFWYRAVFGCGGGGGRWDGDV